MTATDDFWAGAEVIHAYTRAQALEDGVLVDLTEWAGETGFTIPVAITRAAWCDFIEWDEADDRRKPEFTGQDVRGRAHDVLWMLYLAVRRGQGGRRVDFELYRVPREGRGLRPRKASLYALCGPGDNAEPVITIMLPNED